MLKVCAWCRLHHNIFSEISIVGRKTTFKKIVTESKRFSATSNVKRKEKQWQPVIGLEIHAQINSQSKLFSDARNQFMAPPNSLVSCFDAALPGTLPVINKQCVESAILTSAALKCTINHKSYFDRKHYFYADLPQGYQITQHRRPIAVNGHLTIPVNVGSGKEEKIEWKRIHIEQIQLEQDSGKSLHDHIENTTLIDLNRAGVGLMEIVTAPDFSSAEEAATFVLDLQLTLHKLGTCQGKIAEGQMRVDANISIHQPGEPFGIRSEVKNIAGIRNLKLAVEYEIKRQKNLLEEGERVVNETRDFDIDKGITISMRDKEEKQDYRFIPEPNLPPLILYDDQTLPNSVDERKLINVDAIKRKIPPKLPKDVRYLLVNDYCLSIAKSTFLMENKMAEYFINVMQANSELSVTTVFIWLEISLLGLMYKRNLPASECPVTPDQLAELLTLLQDDEINTDYAEKTFDIIAENGGSPTQVVDEQNWRMIKDPVIIRGFCKDALKSIDRKVFSKYRPGQYKKSGSKKAVARVVSAVIELSDKRAHTGIAQSIVREMLDELFNKEK